MTPVMDWVPTDVEPLASELVWRASETEEGVPFYGRRLGELAESLSSLGSTVYEDDGRTLINREAMRLLATLPEDEPPFEEDELPYTARGGIGYSYMRPRQGAPT